VRSTGEIIDWEGCLSIPGFVAEIARAAKVTVKAKDRNGKEFRMKGEELFARALQHEIDHLNGVLFTDRVEDLSTLRKLEPREAEGGEVASSDDVHTDDGDLVMLGARDS
jgi:peptide deformylase